MYISDGNFHIETVLLQLEPYIVKLAHQICKKDSGVDVDDVIQNTRIQFWKALRRDENIKYPYAFLRRIVHNEFINLLRQSNHKVLSLVLDEDGELRHGKLLAKESGELDDPERVFEQRSAYRTLMERLLSAIMLLPRCQRQAILCSLWERVDDLTLLEVFNKIEHMQWPEQPVAVSRLKASLSPARQKIALYIEEIKPSLPE